MKITKLTYAKRRPVQEGIDQKFGVDIELEEGDDPKEAIKMARLWVMRQMVRTENQFWQPKMGDRALVPKDLLSSGRYEHLSEWKTDMDFTLGKVGYINSVQDYVVSVFFIETRRSCYFRKEWLEEA